jgi:Methylpurine-DNA glycosylase (MPG)
MKRFLSQSSSNATEIPELPLLKMVDRKRQFLYVRAFVSGENAAIPGKLPDRTTPLEAPPDMAARLVLGKLLVRRTSDALLVGRIVQVEAYFGRQRVSGRPIPHPAPASKKTSTANWRTSLDARSSQRAAHRNPSFSAVNLPCNSIE